MRLKLLVACAVMSVVMAVTGAAATASADEIISRMIARSKEQAEHPENKCFVCRRVTVIETLDSDGEVTERKTKEHRVASTNGVETARVVKIDGEEPEVREARKEEHKERENREKYVRPSAAKKRRGPEAVDESLIRRFHYTLSGTEVVAGRTNYVLDFRPKPVSKGGEIADRVLGLLAGRIWVDAEEHELVRVDAHLSKAFDLLGGIAASINRLDFAIERVRLSDGSWVNGTLKSEVRGRKLFSTMHSRMNVEQDGFEIGTFIEDQP
jgi:hypothetical protein